MGVVDLLNSAIGAGVDATKLTTGQVCLRAVIVFCAALAIVRFADKRFFARKTAFDFILGFILASIMARAINGSEQLVPTLAAAFILAALHRLLGWIALRLAWIWWSHQGSRPDAGGGRPRRRGQAEDASPGAR
jgi:hypothetical protein